MMKVGGRGQGAYWRLFIGAVVVVTVSGCSGSPTRPPMPDMSNLVPINNRVPVELQETYIVERFDTKPLALNLTPTRFNFSTPVLPYVDVDAALKTYGYPASTPIQHGPRLALYDGLKATVDTTAKASPARNTNSVKAVAFSESSPLSASAPETVAPDSIDWLTPDTEPKPEKEEVIAVATPEPSTPPIVNAAASLALFYTAPVAEPAAMAATTPVDAAALPVEALDPITVVAPLEVVDVEEPTWTVERGPFRNQALRWGEDDPLWTVHWLAADNPIIDIDHYVFTGPLDEVLIQAVSSLAAAGAPIRIERARANHQLVIKGKE